MALFKLEKKASRGPAGKWDVLVGEDMCKACGFCLGVCPVDVFAWRKAPNRLGWFPMYVAHEQNCIGCMLCYQICPDFCIDVSPKAVVAGGVKGHEASDAGDKRGGGGLGGGAARCAPSPAQLN